MQRPTHLCLFAALIITTTACPEEPTAGDPLAARVDSLELAQEGIHADIDALTESSDTGLAAVRTDLEAMDADLAAAEARLVEVQDKLDETEARLDDVQRNVSFSLLVYTTATDCTPNRTAGPVPSGLGCVRNDVGNYTLSWPTGTFEVRPACVVSSVAISEPNGRWGQWMLSEDDSTRVQMRGPSGNEDNHFSIDCDARLN